MNIRLNLIFSILILCMANAQKDAFAHNEQPNISLLADNVNSRFVATTTRHTSLFNNNWKFNLSDNPQYREPEFDDSSWRMLNLPHDWSIEEEYCPDCKTGGNNGYFKEGIGWYRKEFVMSPKLKNKQFVIQFDGVFMNSEVWINGHFLGRRPYGYSTFQYDITRFLDFDENKKNVMAVRVDNSFPKATRWYNGSGIYRNVHLIETNYVHFDNYDGVYITTPEVTSDRAMVHVDYKIISNYFSEEELQNSRKKKYNSIPIPHKCQIISIVYDMKGMEVCRKVDEKIMNSYDKYVTCSQNIDVGNPTLWSDINPQMYYLKSEIVFENNIIDDQITRFGIRKLEFNPQKGMLVNGRQVKLKGVCIHHDASSLGAAVPNDVLEFRLKKLKEMGCNAIRTSHNPFSIDFYNICDKLGLYVMDECFDEWKDGWEYNFTENPRGKAENGYQLYFDQWAETDLRDMICRDRNHPCVVIYGIGNEIPFFKDIKAEEITKKLVSVCHNNDVTRPVTLGNNAPDKTCLNGVDQQMDIIGYNYILRQHPDSAYLPKRMMYPNKLFLGSETGTEMKYFLAYRDNNYVIGQFIWTGIDYLGETKKAPQRGWQSSLLDVCCNPREKGLLFTCCWSEKPKIFITATQDSSKNAQYYSSWNWEDKERTFVKVYSNCEYVELLLNGKSIEKKKNNLDSYFVSFEVPFKKGKITAIGINGDRKVTREDIVTSDKAEIITASVTKPILKANGEDVAIIEVSICDKNKVIVPDAKNNISVNVKGEAKFIGMDTRNLYYDGNFKTPNRNATNGRLIIYVQSTNKIGEANVTLTSKGLKTKNIKLKILANR